MGKFSLSAVPQKRGAPEGGDAAKKKFPRASELVIDDARAATRPSQTRRPETAPLIVAIYEYSKRAGDVWEKFAGTEAALFQIQMKHEARPSALFDMGRGFNEYLRQAHAEDASIPESTTQLQDAGARNASSSALYIMYPLLSLLFSTAEAFAW